MYVPTSLSKQFSGRAKKANNTYMCVNILIYAYISHIYDTCGKCYQEKRERTVLERIIKRT